LGEPRDLRSEQTCRPHPEQRRHGDEEDHKSYAPEPVGPAAPEQDGWRLAFDVREQRGACRGEPAHRLEG
jgi:hypothetical protein